MHYRKEKHVLYRRTGENVADKRGGEDKRPKRESLKKEGAKRYALGGEYEAGVGEH